MRLLSLQIVTILSLLPVITAQCWRNTTCNGPRTAAFPGVWQQDIFAPGSRTVTPESVILQDGRVSPFLSSQWILFANDTQFTFDFSREVGGIVSLECTSSNPARLGLAFTEAKDYIGHSSDSSNGLKTRWPHSSLTGPLTFSNCAGPPSRNLARTRSAASPVMSSIHVSAELISGR